MFRLLLWLVSYWLHERCEEGDCTLQRWPKSWEICGCTILEILKGSSW